MLEAALVRRAVAAGLLAVLLLRRVFLAVRRLLGRVLVSTVRRLALLRWAAELLLVRLRITRAALGRRAVGRLLGVALVVVRATHDGDGR